MAEQLASLPFSGRVVAGRAAGSDSDPLRLGDEVGALVGRTPRVAKVEGESGTGTQDLGEFDLAVKALEGQSALAKGLDGAFALLAVGPRGSMMSVPDMYMQKIVVGPAAAGAIDIEAPLDRNMRAVAAALGKEPSELNVVVLDRPRHEDLLAEIRSCGARVKLVEDGDVSAGIAAAVEETGIDMCVGIGGSTEGIITAAAMRCLGGEIQARFWPVSRYQVETIKAMGIEDVEATLTSKQMVGEGVVVAGTAVTRGRFLRGVEIRADAARTETILMCSHCHKIRLVRTIHRASGAASPVALWAL
jgi:fructose-1,6-bisphosphatase II